MTATPLMVGPAEVLALNALRLLAATDPVNMIGLREKLEDPAAKAAHMAQMTRQSLVLPFGIMVTFSIEIGHPVGVCRHMSLSSPVKGRVPSPEAVNIIAEALGFIGGYQACAVWMEELARGAERENAVNLVQPLTFVAGSSASVTTKPS